MFELDIAFNNRSPSTMIRYATFADAEVVAMAARCRFPAARYFVYEYNEHGTLLRGYDYIENRSSATGGEWRVLFDYQAEEVEHRSEAYSASTGR